MSDKKGAKDAFSLDGRIVVLTGAAGIIGTQVVKSFVEAGARVFAIDRDADLLEENLGPLHDSLITCVADVAKRESPTTRSTNRNGNLRCVSTRVLGKMVLYSTGWSSMRVTAAHQPFFGPACRQAGVERIAATVRRRNSGEFLGVAQPEQCQAEGQRTAVDDLASGLETASDRSRFGRYFAVELPIDGGVCCGSSSTVGGGGETQDQRSEILSEQRRE